MVIPNTVTKLNDFDICFDKVCEMYDLSSAHACRVV